MTNVIAAIAQLAIAAMLGLLLMEVRNVALLLKTAKADLSEIHTTVVDERTIQHGLPRGLRGLCGHIIAAIESKDVQTALSNAIQNALLETMRIETASNSFRARPDNPFIKPKE